jgi:hypothetical protein
MIPYQPPSAVATRVLAQNRNRHDRDTGTRFCYETNAWTFAINVWRFIYGRSMGSTD